MGKRKGEKQCTENDKSYKAIENYFNFLRMYG